MKKNTPISDFLKIYNISGNDVILDVRTPSEYAKGHIVGSLNMPLFTDEERAKVGTIYKKQGKDRAVERGLEFVGPKLAQFVKFAKEAVGGDSSKTIWLYCWRGGMRSNSLAWLLSTAGFKVEVILGGYKSYRRYFLSKLKVGYWQLLILGGPTGCGKTDILSALRDRGEQVVDLEEIAKHRGSAFGVYGYEGEQPTSEQFANILFSQLSLLDNSKVIWCEGESAAIGKVFMPQELYQRIQASRFIYFSLPEAVRLDHIVRDYGDCPKEILIKSFSNITKRLGYDRAKDAIELVERGDIRTAAEIALHYYDKGYNHSIEGRKGEIIARLTLDSDSPVDSAERLVAIKESTIKK